MSKKALYPLALSLLLALAAGHFWSYLPVLAESGAVQLRWPWIPSLDAEIAFRLDGLSLLFALLISGIGALIFAYSASYMRSYTRTGYFFTILFLFALSMLGLVTADHLMLLFIFWELTTITSYLLIGFNFETKTARRNALQALLVTGSSGLVLFAGLVWLGIESGTFYLSDLLESPELITQSAYVVPIFLCIFIGCIAKSAQIPFHFWLPNAMAAPTPVSAYLHSATMVKAGIYLLARTQPLFGDLELWTPLLATLGGITAVWASMLAVKQTDLKQLLAYTTLMALGTLTFLLAFPSDTMVIAAMVFLVVHALYKACLFMVVGIIDLSTGTRQRSQLSGLKKHMPIVWGIALLAGLSMAGILPLFGFIAKELQYEAALTLDGLSIIAIATLMAANALMVYAAYITTISPFRGDVTSTTETLKQKPTLLLCTPPALLAIAGLVFGVQPMLAHSPLLSAAVNDVAGQAVSFKLALWHGINQPLMLSILTLALGGICILSKGRADALCEKITTALPAVEPLYFRKLEWLQRASVCFTKALHNGSLGGYIQLTIAVIFSTLATVILLEYNPLQLVPAMPPMIDWIGVSLSALAISGAIFAVRASTKIMALAALGASGFAMAGIFLLYGALDVAMTQLLVETLFVILAAAILWRVPDTNLGTSSAMPPKTIHWGIAILAGIVTTSIVLVVLKQPLDTSLTYFFEHASFTMANGRNIVNVILVDFRAFDTFGEVYVVAAAALGLWAMTRGTPKIAATDTKGASS